MACKKSVDMGSSCDSSWVISEMEFVNEKCTSTTLNNVMHYLSFRVWMGQNLPWIFVAPQFFYKLCETIIFFDNPLIEPSSMIIYEFWPVPRNFWNKQRKKGKTGFCLKGCGFKTLFEWSESHYVQILSKDD